MIFEEQGMKTSHRAAIAILKEFWNLGIGSAMFEELIAAAKMRGTEIMELEFIDRRRDDDNQCKPKDGHSVLLFGVVLQQA